MYIYIIKIIITNINIKIKFKFTLTFLNSNGITLWCGSKLPAIKLKRRHQRVRYCTK